jgi:ferritin heavy chain
MHLLPSMSMILNYFLFALTLSSPFRDPHLSDYIEAEFLDEQVKSIKEYADYITNLKRVGTGLGEYIFDKEELQA